MKNPFAHFVSAIMLCGAASVLGDSNTAPTNPSASLASLRESARLYFGVLPDKMPGAEDDTPGMVQLGEKLYFDKRLSGNKTLSCNSCHAVDQDRAGVDNEATSPGAFGKRGDRNSPTVLNAGFHMAQFWDGRAATLEEQAKGPILNPIEMAMPNQGDVLKRLREAADYKDPFQKAFPGSADPITYDNVGEAIAAFERTLITKDRFDDFQQGDDKALSGKELRGLEKFLQFGCTACHNGPLLGGNSYQKAGLVNPYENTTDLGRFVVTKQDEDKFKFKVPSLRNVALTGPYFHDGKIGTLEEAVRKMAWLQLDKELDKEETELLVSFLQSLSDKKRGAAAKVKK